MTALGRDGCDEVVERQVGLLLLKYEIHMRVFEHHLLPLPCQLLQLLVHVLYPVQTILELRVLGNRLQLLNVWQRREELLVVSLQFERVVPRA